MNRNTLIGFILIGFVLLFWPTYLDFVFPEKDTEAQQEKVLSKTERPPQQKKSSPLVMPDNTKAEALKESGAKEIYSYIAHGVLSGEALNKIENSAIKELVLTDSIQASEEVKNTKNIRHISVAPLMGEAIKRINSDSSVSALFD